MKFQEVGGKPDKKRAALDHFDTILGLDKVMVQLTIRTVLVSLMQKIREESGEYLNPGWIICWVVVSVHLPTGHQEESRQSKKEQFSGRKKSHLDPI